VLRVQIYFPAERSFNRDTVTLITTLEGIQPIIIALWRLKDNGLDIMPAPPSGVSLSLDFKVKSSARRAGLANLVLKPWEKLHGVKQLAVTGDIADSMRQRLRKCMLEGPFPEDLALNLREYHSTGQKEMTQNNYTTAQWWWSLFDRYRGHLLLLLADFRWVHEIKDTNSQPWKEVWIESKRMFFQVKLGLLKTCLHQLKYNEALLNTETALYDVYEPLIDVGYIVPPILKAKFCLGKALALNALGEVGEGMHVRTTAALILFSTGRYRDNTVIDTVELISKILQTSIDTELTRLMSPDQGGRLVRERGNVLSVWEADSNRTFWEWLDLPEG